MSELLDSEMTGVGTETKWLDKVAWFFIVWSAAYLTANYILPVEPSLVQFPDRGIPDSSYSNNNWLVWLAGLVLGNKEKVLASYLVLNLVVMLLAYGLLHRVKYIHGPFVLTLYLTLIFHFLKWVVMVVYLKMHGIDAITDDPALSSMGRLAKALMYSYTAYIVLLWFGFRWLSRRMRAKEITFEFDQAGLKEKQPQ